MGISDEYERIGSNKNPRFSHRIHTKSALALKVIEKKTKNSGELGIRTTIKYTYKSIY